MEENKIIKDNAATMYVSSPKASYGIFCFNSQGDLFLNSDWGFFGFAWRAYGKDFKEFLKSLNSEYVVGKFEYNWNMDRKGKFTGRRKECVTELVSIFLQELRKDEAVRPFNDGDGKINEQGKIVG